MPAFKYIASKFSDSGENIFSVHSMEITRDEFCEFIRATKMCSNVCINDSLLLTDSKCDFGDMQGCKIRKLTFSGTGYTTLINYLKNILTIKEKYYLLVSLESISSQIFAFHLKCFDYHLSRFLFHFIYKYAYLYECII